MAEKQDAAISATIVNQNGVVGKQEGVQEFRPTEKRVMSRDTSDLDQKAIMRAWIGGGAKHWSVGGVEVTEDEYMAALHKKH
jgi:hypothetical protein